MERLSQQLNILLLAIVLIIGCCILGCTVWLWTSDYNSLTTNLLSYVGKLDWRVYFEKEVFPASRFFILRYLLLGALVLWTVLGYYYYKNGLYFSQLILQFFQRSITILRRQMPFENASEKRFFWLIIIIVALRQLWQMHHYELQYDEAWTYNHFVSKGFFISAISPNNNHVLYTLLACITDYIPIEAKYSLRLPVYLGGLASIILFYWMLRSIWGWRWAMIGLVWFATSFSVTFYMMYARGYIFQLFFTILACWALLRICVGINNKRYYWVVFVLATILGFYSVPTQAYVWLCFNLILIGVGLKGKLVWKDWVLANVSIVLLTAILYFPVLITNGFEILFQAAAVDTPQGEAFISYQDKVADWLLFGGGRGTPVYWFLMLMIITLMLLLLKIKKEQLVTICAIITCVLFLLFPSILNLLMGTQPPYRVWCFLAVFIGMTIPIIGTTIEQLWFQKRSNNLLLIALALTFTSLNIWRAEVHYALQWSAELDREAKKIAGLLLKQNVKECYFFSDYDKPLLEFYYLRANQVLKTAMIAPNSKNYAPFVDAPLFEAILWDKEDRVATIEEQQWLEQHYSVVLYENKRISLLMMNYEL